MSKFEIVKEFYQTKKSDGTPYWSIEKVKNAVVKKWITKAQYKEITGENYA